MTVVEHLQIIVGHRPVAIHGVPLLMPRPTNAGFKIAIPVSPVLVGASFPFGIPEGITFPL